ncbi:MAG: sodium:proton antiporter, partial [Fimbriimonadaceae bacterium]|nr:sodium:proton antiporter [Chitinophagales bacterium]
VMISLVAKLLNNKDDRFWFAAIIIIAANAGGAWSPLGDVTTTMLWIGGQITAWNIIKVTFIPSLIVCIIPALIILRRINNNEQLTVEKELSKNNKQGYLVLFSAILLLLLVPVFKTVLHIPPFMSMLFSLGIMWILTSIIHFNKGEQEREKYSVTHALRNIDTPSILFFLGILLAVSALQSSGVLLQLADNLNNATQNVYVIGIILGLLSAVVDNVPLVAAAQGMYDLSVYPTDHVFWEFIALTTGTGGSIIIIGSAAGVAVMGIEKINFIDYLKKISWIAAIGFLAGAFAFILFNSF